MGNYISSEHLKHKNTFAKKLVWLAPILTLFLNVLVPCGINKIHITGGMYYYILVI